MAEIPNNNNENQDVENLALINGNIQSPYVSEVSHSGGVRNVSVIAWKGMYYAFIILLCVEILQCLIGFILFREIPSLKIAFCLMLLPIIIPFLFVPIKAICTFDYNNKVFSCYKMPMLPIPYKFLIFSVNFSEISYFYFAKMKSLGKKNYKIGLKTHDDQDKIIIFGQDHTCSKEFDIKLSEIPVLLRHYLKE